MPCRPGERLHGRGRGRHLRRWVAERASSRPRVERTVRRSPLRRSLTSISPVASPLPTTTMVGMPSRSASAKATPALVPRSSSSTRRPARSSDSPSACAASCWPALPIAMRWMSAGATDARPDQSAVVVVLLDDRRDGAADPDAVRAHRDAHRRAVGAEHVELEGVGVLAAELEDVADLDGPADDQRLAAAGAGIALGDGGDVEVALDREVASRGHVEDVVVVLVGARHPARTGEDPGVGVVA